MEGSEYDLSISRNFPENFGLRITKNIFFIIGLSVLIYFCVDSFVCTSDHKTIGAKQFIVYILSSERYNLKVWNLKLRLISG